MSNYTAVLTTVPERHAALAETLHSLMQVGIQPIVELQRDPHRGGLAFRRNCIEALSKGIDASTDYVLYLEDDITVNLAFPAWLNAGCNSGYDAVTYYLPGLCFYSAAIRRAIVSGNAFDPGIYRLRNKSNWYGCQAILLKRSIAIAVITGWDDHNPDERIKTCVSNIYYCYPNPVQHGDCKPVWSPYGHPQEYVVCRLMR